MPSRNVGSPFSVKRVSRTPRPSPWPPGRTESRPPPATRGAAGVVSGRSASSDDRRAGPAQEFLVLPVAAAARLAGDDQVEARHEGDQLASGAGLGAGVGRDAPAAPASLAGQARGQLPAVGEDLGVDLEAHLRAADVVGRCGGLLDEPLRDHLPVHPSGRRGPCSRRSGPGRAPACPARATDDGRTSARPRSDWNDQCSIPSGLNSASMANSS